MAKQVSNSPPLLVRDKQGLKDQIQERIKLGESILAISITNEPEKKEAWLKFHSWNNFNYETIASAFNISRHKHEHQYHYRPPFDPSAIGYGRPVRKTFVEHVEEYRDAVRMQIRKLNEFHDIIDLQQTVPVFEKKIPFNNDLENLINLLNRFHKVARKLRNRHAGRKTIEIEDEYDVQDLLEGLLQIYFDDVRSEDPVPITAGASSRIDFVLKFRGILLEVKMTNEKLGDKKLGEELLIDIGRYKSYPKSDNLVIFIYDRGEFIHNKHALIADLEQQSTPDLKITVVVNPN